MTDLLHTRLNTISARGNRELLTQLCRGIEKEALRVTTPTQMSQISHPSGLGSALTHPFITTDYSESLLEFITPPDISPHQTLQCLKILHKYTYQHLPDDEMIWPSSMPCGITNNNEVPIAQYGTSNTGKLKHLYRKGLDTRYGRIMQTIAGIHYNFSVPLHIWTLLEKHPSPEWDTEGDIKSQGYLGLIRNFRRYSWLLLYLFGASPAFDKSFLQGKSIDTNRPPVPGLKEVGSHSYIAPYATSLRMSDLGYQNNAQASLYVCYNKLDQYIKTVYHAIHEPFTPYQAKGVKVDGEYIQLNTNLLQIENEYYSDIRPKCLTQGDERPIEALEKRGIDYVEVRCLDINPYLPVGINIQQIRFMDVFLTYCLLQDSPFIDENSCTIATQNIKKVVLEGRNPELTLTHPLTSETLILTDWARQLLNDMLVVAQSLDDAHGGNDYVLAVQDQLDKVIGHKQLPSAQVATALLADNADYTDLIWQLSRQHRLYFNQIVLDQTKLDELVHISSKSLRDQAEIEAQPQQPFEDYLAEFMSLSLKSV